MQLSTAYKQHIAKAARVAASAALVVSSVGTAIAPQAHATALNTVSTLISDSRTTGANPDYTISFTLEASRTTPIQQVDVQFCTTADTFGTNCTPPTGLAVPANMASTVVTGFNDTSVAGVAAQTDANNFHVDFTGNTEDEVPATVHSIKVVGMTNPTAVGTYFTRIKTYSDAGSTEIDQGTSAFAIVNRVTVSGRVLEQMTFTVGLVGSATACGAGDTSNIATTVTTVPFGNFNSGSPRIGCQTVKTATNAVGGYVTTIRQVRAGAGNQGGMCRQTSGDCTTDGAGGSTAATDIIVDTGLTTTPGAYGAGVFGVGVSANGAEKNALFTGNNSYRSMFGTTPIAVAGKTSPSAGVDTYVVFKADVPATQTAGVYQNSVEYVSTPTF